MPLRVLRPLLLGGLAGSCRPAPPPEPATGAASAARETGAAVQPPPRDSAAAPAADSAPTVVWAVAPGVIVHYGRSDSVLVVHGPVRAGAALTAVVTTYGGGCVRAAGARVEYPAAGLAVVTPLDSAVVNLSIESPIDCDLVGRRLRRPVRLRFPRPGPAVVRVRGRVVPGDSLVEVDRPVRVVP